MADSAHPYLISAIVSPNASERVIRGGLEAPEAQTIADGVEPILHSEPVRSPTVQPAGLVERRGFTFVLVDDDLERVTAAVLAYVHAFEEVDDVSLHVLAGHQVEAVQEAILKVLEDQGRDPKHIPDLSLVPSPVDPEAIAPFLRAADAVIGSPRRTLEARLMDLPGFVAPSPANLRTAFEQFQALSWSHPAPPIDTCASERWLCTTEDWTQPLESFLSHADAHGAAMLLRLAPGTAEAEQERIVSWLEQHGYDPERIPDLILIDAPKAAEAAIFRQATAWIETENPLHAALAKASGLKPIRPGAEPLPLPVRRDYLVSAIVSTYKSERFIVGCLDDLLAQSLGDQVEIVVVNCNSPQGEDRIIREYGRVYPNIRYVMTPERETVYASWNRGIQASSGRYLTNANTDDRHRRDALARMVEVLEANPHVALVYADVLITDTENETVERCTPTGAYRWMEWNRSSLVDRGCFMGPQPMWRRSVHEEYGYFDDSFVTSGDYEFWLRISQTNEFLHIREFLGLYLRSPASIEHSNRDRQRAENERLLKLYREARDAGTIVRRTRPADPAEALRIHNSKAEELAARGMLQSAQIVLEQVLEDHPELSVLNNNLGVLAFQEGRHQEAVQCFQTALAADETYQEAIENLAQCLMSQQAYGEALPWLERALGMRPDDPTLTDALQACRMHMEGVTT